MNGKYSIKFKYLCIKRNLGLPISEQHRLPLMPSDKKRISRLLEKIQRFNVEEKIAYEVKLRNIFRSINNATI